MEEFKSVQCTECGASISENAEICPHCGVKNKRKKKKTSWVKRILIFFIAVSAFNAVFGNSNTTENSPPAPVETTIGAVIAEQETYTASVTTPAEVAVVETNPQIIETEEIIPYEYRAALRSATGYADRLHMSKQSIYDQLVSEYGEKFSAEAAQYAIDNLVADWNANALAKAESYSNSMHMSKQAIYDQLISEYGDQFTKEEAQYAIDNIIADWNANALEKAKTYQRMNMSPAAIRDQLVSAYGEQFTASEADYAIANLPE